MPVIKRILCPIDFTDIAAAGAREAAALARAVGAELLLVHVMHEPWLSEAGERGYASPVAQQYELLMRSNLIATASALSGLARVRWTLTRGPVDRAIAQAASKHGADIIVMGSRARGGLKWLLRDSTAEKVTRLARVPVVRVPPGGDKGRKQPAAALHRAV